MLQRIGVAAVGLGVSGMISLGVAFAQTASPSPSMSPSPSATTTTVPSAPPSTGMGGN